MYLGLFSIISVLLFLSLISVTYANQSWHSTIAYKCSVCCDPEKPVTISLWTRNFENNNMTVDAIKLVSSSDDIFATKGEIDGFGTSITGPDGGKTFKIDTTWPDTGYDYIKYKACFYIIDWPGHSEKWYCTDYVTKKYEGNYECQSDNDCEDFEYCDISGCVSECKPVVQESACGHIDNHRWINYECCSDSDCQVNYICKQHECIEVAVKTTTSTTTTTTSTTTSSTTTSSTLNTISETVCEGCLYEGNCLGYGTRILKDNTPLYCDLNKEIKIQKEVDEICKNNYECKSNLCSDGTCYNIREEIQETKGLLQIIIHFLKSLFGLV